MKSFVVRICLLVLICSFYYQNVFAQSAQVTFQVNMKYQIENALFNLTTETVDVAGTFNNWGTTRLDLSDADGDSIYSRTISNFTIGQSIEFKFRINGAWNDREEFPGAGNNRAYTVKSSSDTISVWYNDLKLEEGPPIAEFSSAKQEIFATQSLQFYNQSSGIIDSYDWFFEGGSPLNSTAENPTVFYRNEGVFDVQLITKNTKGEADTLLVPDYIVVKPAQELEKTAPKWWNESVFYEIFVRSFYDSDGDGIGDFNGITQKLDYLNDGDSTTTTDLGITGIWLMPINPSPSYHGYDVTDYRGVNPDFGTMEDFKNLLSEAHKRGIKVIIDYVMNHSSDEHPWFQNAKSSSNSTYRNFYNWSDTKPNYNGPWGQTVWHNLNGAYYYGIFYSGMPDLNYNTAAVKDSLFNAASFWIDEVGIDGFRLDAVKYIFENGSILEDLTQTHEFFAEFTSHIKKNNPDIFTVGEAWTSTNKVLDYVTNNRIDYAFEFDVATAILNSVNSENSSSVKNAITNAYNSYPFLQYGLFLTNHDMNRAINSLGNFVPRNKAATSLYLTLPGIPYVYYGEEIGMTGSKPDEFIRTPMLWDASSNAGFTTGNPWIRVNSEFSNRNVALQENDNESLLNHYKRLIHTRNKTIELQKGDFHITAASDERLLVFLRTMELGNIDNTVLVISNVSNQTVSNANFSINGFGFNEDRYDAVDLLTDKAIVISQQSADKYYFGDLLPYETYVLKLNGASVEVEPTNKVGQFKLEPAFPNPFNPSTTIRYSLDTSGETQIELFDVLGKKVQTLINEFKQSGTYSTAIHLNGFASGVYFIKLTQNEQTAFQKISFVK